MPVLRIFGTTPGLQKICANIHLCYPYFYVPFPMDSNDPLRPERVIKLCQRFAVSLNHAICLAMRQNPTSAASISKNGGGTDPRHLHVVSVMLVKGVPFYGYHIGYSYFLKISLVNPSRMFVALEQLRKPAVLGREWQPHEAHMNHVLQFMCDFDLYGCGWLELGGGTFREPLPGESLGLDMRLWQRATRTLHRRREPVLRGCSIPSPSPKACCTLTPSRLRRMLSLHSRWTSFPIISSIAAA
jgi:DNA polymerase zeta